MFKKGMIIPIKNLNEWKIILKKLEEETNYLWAGSEGVPTKMPDSAFDKYKHDCGIFIEDKDENKILYYGTSGRMRELNEHSDYDVVPAHEICKIIRRF